MNRRNPLLAGVIALVLGAAGQIHAAGPAPAKSIALGFVSEKPPAEVEAHFQDFMRYLGQKLAVEARVVAAPTVSQLTKLLDEKKVDFYMDSPYPTYLVNRQGAARLLLRRWKSGMAEYHSILFAKKDGRVSGFADLKGKIVAFEDPGSTSAYFLPKVFLLKKGLQLKEKAAPESKPPPGEIGYIFTYSTAKTVDLVLSDKAAAGAFSNDDHDRLDEKAKTQIVKLGETESVPRSLVSTRKDLDPGMAQRLKETLLAMPNDEEGKKILARTDGTTKFDPLPGGEEAMRRRLVELFRPRGKN